MGRTRDRGRKGEAREGRRGCITAANLEPEKEGEKRTGILFLLFHALQPPSLFGREKKKKKKKKRSVHLSRQFWEL